VVHWAGDDWRWWRIRREQVCGRPAQAILLLPQNQTLGSGKGDAHRQQWRRCRKHGGRVLTDDPDSVQREIAAHDHRNYPEAVNANPVELRGGDFDPREFRALHTTMLPVLP
jgi:hypothetical protein